MVKESDMNPALTNPDALDDEIYLAGSDDEQILLDEATGGSSDVDDASADITFAPEIIHGEEETSDNDQKNENEELAKIEKKRKRRLKDKERKKRKIELKDEETTLRDFSRGTQSLVFRHFLADCSAKENLTKIEAETLAIDDSRFVDGVSFEQDHSLDKISHYVKSVLPEWDSIAKAILKKRKKKSKSADAKVMADPFILVLCSSAIRCMDVIRSLRNLHISAKIGKLFAKHMKIDEQVEFLKKNPVHIAVGTPNRVLKLMEKEAFSTNSLKLVLLDSTFKDSKQRTIFTLPECKQDLFNLYRHYLIRLLSNKTNDDESLIKDKESESGINEQEQNQRIMMGLY